MWEGVLSLEFDMAKEKSGILCLGVPHGMSVDPWITAI
jgi:hypothetical protein